MLICNRSATICNRLKVINDLGPTILDQQSWISSKSAAKIGNIPVIYIRSAVVCNWLLKSTIDQQRYAIDQW